MDNFYAVISRPLYHIHLFHGNSICCNTFLGVFSLWFWKQWIAINIIIRLIILRFWLTLSVYIRNSVYSIENGIFMEWENVLLTAKIFDALWYREAFYNPPDFTLLKVQIENQLLRILLTLLVQTLSDFPRVLNVIHHRLDPSSSSEHPLCLPSRITKTNQARVKLISLFDSPKRMSLGGILHGSNSA